MLALSSAPAQAHEVVPTIADLTVTQERAELSLRINLEAFLAGVDLDTIEDTDTAPQAQDYDALRALPAEALAARAHELLDGWNAVPVVSVDGTPVALESVSIMVPEDVNIEQPRIAEWALAGRVRAGETVTVTWPQGAVIWCCASKGWMRLIQD